MGCTYSRRASRRAGCCGRTAVCCVTTTPIRRPTNAPTNQPTQAIRTIQTRNKSQPLWLHVAFQAVHGGNWRQDVPPQDAVPVGTPALDPTYASATKASIIKKNAHRACLMATYARVHFVQDPPNDVSTCQRIPCSAGAGRCSWQHNTGSPGRRHVEQHLVARQLRQRSVRSYMHACMWFAWLAMACCGGC